MPHSISPETRPPSEPMETDDQQDGSSSPIPTPGDSDAMDVSQSGAPDVDKKVDVKLEDLFQTDDEDEEFLSSAPTGAAPASSSPLPDAAPAQPAAKYSDPETMLAFYQRLFPFRPLFQWLNHSAKPSNDFAHREFAFTLSNDAYLRYQSYTTPELLRKDVCKLNPSRFEIGPVYSTNPRDRKTLRSASAFRPLAKELVFDIDLTDYDEVRTCCTGADICAQCWRFITMAVKVVDAALREDFGFQHVLWVYSGRRGAHAWISDRRAREMGDEKRRALAGYLEVVRGGSQGGKKVNVRRPLHPHLVRSLDLLKGHFQTDILEDQDPWATPERAEHLLSLLPDKGLVDALRKKWAAAPTRSSASKWADIDAVAKSGASAALDGKALLEAKRDVVLEYTYPRLDVEVSKKLNHLLKSPFVVHPKTGRVCVPIDVRRLERFDPFAVPTVTDLLGEIDEWDRDAEGKGEGEIEGEGEADRKIQDYEKTSLKPYVEVFKEHVAALLRAEQSVKREREEEDPMEF